MNLCLPHGCGGKLKGMVRSKLTLGSLTSSQIPPRKLFSLGRTLVKLVFSADWLSTGANKPVLAVNTLLWSVEFTSFFLTLVSFAEDFYSLSPNPRSGIDAAVALAADS